MKKQISTEPIDLTYSYSLFSLLFISIGALLLGYSFFDPNSIFNQKEEIKILLIVFLLLGILGFILANKFVPYCYKVEVSNQTIYITKKDTVILTQIDKTIAINKDQIQKIAPSILGLRILFWENRLFYLHLNHKSEFGERIAFLTQLRNVYDLKNSELEELI